MEENKKQSIDKSDFDGKTKGMRLSSSTRALYESMKEAAGVTDDSFIDHLLHILKLYELQQSEPEFESELKELQKYMNRISTVFIRMREKETDALEEVKDESRQHISHLEQVVNSLKDDLSNLQKQLATKEKELKELNVLNGDLKSKLEQSEKAIQTSESLNRLTNEKIEVLQKRVNDLEQAEEKLNYLESRLEEVQHTHTQKLASYKEQEVTLRKQILDLQRQNELLIQEATEVAEQKRKEYERDIEAIRKEMRMEAKENFLREKAEWQENMDQRINQISEQYTMRIAAILERLQLNKTDKN